MPALQARDLNLPDERAKHAPAGKDAKAVDTSTRKVDTAINMARQQCLKLIDTCDIQCRNTSNHTVPPPSFATLRASITDSETVHARIVGHAYQTLAAWLFNSNKYVPSIQISKSAIAVYKLAKHTHGIVRCQLLVVRATTLALEVEPALSDEKLSGCCQCWNTLVTDATRLDLELESDVGYYHGLSLLRLALTAGELKLTVIPRMVAAWREWLTVPSHYAPSQRAVGKPAMQHHHQLRLAAVSQLNYLQSRLALIGNQASLQLQCLDLIATMHEINVECAAQACAIVQQSLIFARHGNFQHARTLALEAATSWKKAEKQRSTAKSFNIEDFNRQLALYHALKSQLHLLLSVTPAPGFLTQSLAATDLFDTHNVTRKPNILDAIAQAESQHSLSLIHWRDRRVSDSLASEMSAYSLYSKLLHSMRTLLTGSSNDSKQQKVNSEKLTSSEANSRYYEVFAALSTQSSLHACWTILSSIFHSLRQLCALYEHMGNIRASVHYLSLACELNDGAHGDHSWQLMLDRQRMERMKDSLDEQSTTFPQSVNDKDLNAKESNVDEFTDFTTTMRSVLGHCHAAAGHTKHSRMEDASHHYQLALDALNHIIEANQRSDGDSNSDDEDGWHPLHAYRAHIAVKLAALPVIDSKTLINAGDEADECHSVLDAAWANYWLAHIDQQAPEQPKAKKAVARTRSTRSKAAAEAERQQFDPWHVRVAMTRIASVTNGVKRAQQRLAQSLAATFTLAPPCLTRLLSVDYAHCLGFIDPLRASFALCHSIGVSHRHLINAASRAKRTRIQTKLNATPASDEACRGDNEDMSTLMSTLGINDSSISTNDATNHFDDTLETEHERYQRLLAQLPSDWSVVTVGLTDDHRHLLVSQAQKSLASPPCMFKLPLYHPINSNRATSVYDWTCQEFASIIADSHTANHSIADKARASAREKQQWWERRHELDERMRNLLWSMEQRWFGPWIGALLGKQLSNRVQQSIASAAQTLTQFVADQLKIAMEDDSVVESLIVSLLAVVDSVNDAQLQSAVAWLLGFTNSMHEPLAIDALTRDQQKSLTVTVAEFRKHSGAIDRASANTKNGLDEACSERGPVVLILDSRLHALPFESMPSLAEQSITRMPAWTDIEARLCRFDKPIHYATSHYYLLDPEDNLQRTQQTIEPRLSAFGLMAGDTGSCPTSASLLARLNGKQLFLYCGHGGCDQFVAREQVELLDAAPRVAVLMGCSSGKVKGVSRELEGEGMVLSLIRAGSDCVVGNLWDVTDGDCDRFTLDLLGRISESRGQSLASFVPSSRSSCKLRYLMGASPVVYGLPITLQC